MVLEIVLKRLKNIPFLLFKGIKSYIFFYFHVPNGDLRYVNLLIMCNFYVI